MKLEAAMTHSRSWPSVIVESLRVLMLISPFRSSCLVNGGFWYLPSVTDLLQPADISVGKYITQSWTGIWLTCLLFTSYLSFKPCHRLHIRWLWTLWFPFPPIQAAVALTLLLCSISNSEVMVLSMQNWTNHLILKGCVESNVSSCAIYNI